jgi:cold shock CspA family protein
MTKAPLPETVRLIARILKSRPTDQEEVPSLISAVHRTIERLNGEPRPVALESPPVAEHEPREVRPRGRRRQEEIAPPEPTAPVVAAPQLIRRATAPTPENPSPSPFAAAATTPRTGLRGVVKWYDPRTRSGALRLPGHDDVAVDADAVERAGIPRLFKGQEIEASIVVDPGGTVRLLTISLPGRPETEISLGGAVAGGRRQGKQVVIEMKRDALRRVGARLEAEQLLGRNR